MASNILPITAKNFPQIIKTQRQSRHIAQQEVADAVAVSLRSYQNYERGEQSPTLETVDAILDFLFGKAARPAVHASGDDDVIWLPVHQIGEDDTETCYEPYARRQITQLTGQSGAGLVVGVVVGNANVGDFVPGTRFVYQPTDQILGSGAHVFLLRGQYVIKDVLPLHAGAILLKCRNPQYPEEILTPVTDEIGEQFVSNLTQRTEPLNVVGKVLVRLAAE